MDVSIFLGKAFTFYLLITSLAILLNPTFFLAVFDDIIASKGLFLFVGILALMLGILLLLVHNVWVFAWPVIITILAWLTFLKGATYVLFPAVREKLIIFRRIQFYRWGSIVNLLVGAFLGFNSFIQPILH